MNKMCTTRFFIRKRGKETQNKIFWPTSKNDSCQTSTIVTQWQLQLSVLSYTIAYSIKEAERFGLFLKPIWVPFHLFGSALSGPMGANLSSSSDIWNHEFVYVSIDISFAKEWNQIER